MSDEQSAMKPEEPSTTPGAATSVEHIAPEDHYASGGQQKDQKKVLKKSVQDGQSEAPVDQNAGVHSTGSHTGTTGGSEKR